MANRTLPCISLCISLCFSLHFDIIMFPVRVNRNKSMSYNAVGKLKLYQPRVGHLLYIDKVYRMSGCTTTHIDPLGTLILQKTEHAVSPLYYISQVFPLSVHTCHAALTDERARA